MQEPTPSDPTWLLSHRGRNASEQPISQLMHAALSNPNIISLAAGFVDNQTLPADHVMQAAQQILGDTQQGQIALQYGSNEGHLPLRKEIARRNFSGDPEAISQRMILTAGSNQFLHLVSTCLFNDGDIVLCAAPTYFVFLGLLKDLGVRAWGIETDDDGMNPEALERTLADLEQRGELPRVKAIYLIPYSDNPGGTTIPETRRREILDVFHKWSRKSSMVLLVDNAYRDLRYVQDDVPCMTDLGADPETTVESGTFSKNFSPGLRVGWGTVPDWLHQPATRCKAVIDFGSAHLNQQLMFDLIKSGRFDTQVQTLRQAYHSKMNAMLEACAAHLESIQGLKYHHPTGGLYVWVTLPEGIDASPGSALWEECVAQGVLYVPGEFCFPPEGAAVKKNSMRLSFGVQSEQQIHEGIRILGQAIASVMQPVDA